MLILYVSILIVGLALTWRTKGAFWVHCLSCLVCFGPVAFGIINYSYLFDDGRATSDFLIAATLSFGAGAAAATILQRRGQPAQAMSRQAFRFDFEQNLRLAKILWFVGLAGMVMQFADLASGGVSALTNLDEIRESVVTREAATVFGRAAVLLSWANIYVFLFALVFRKELGRNRFLWLGSAAINFFLCGLLIAGRQSAFQLILLVIIGQTIARRRAGEQGSVIGARVVSIAFGASLVAYMAYVAITRVDQRVFASKESVLQTYFRFELSPAADSFFNVLGAGIRSAMVEGLVYFTHSVALLDRFLSLHVPVRFSGATSFPLAYRQIESFTGLSPEDAYRYKVQVLDSAGYAGVGWSTAYSTLYIDFGTAGTMVVLGVLGAVTTWCWSRVQTRGDFNLVVVAVLLMVNVVYLPLLWGLSDQNLFIGLVFSALFSASYTVRSRRTGRPGRTLVDA